MTDLALTSAVTLGPRPALRSGTWMAQRDRLLLLACLTIAAAFRLSDIQQPLIDAFSWRQASTAMMADNFRLGGWNIFYPEVSWTGPGPSYQGREFQIVSYLTAILHAVFGWHDWLGRVVAVSFGVLTTFALHRLTDEIWGPAAAHLVALAYAILPGAIVIDRSFLPDPAMLALITTGAWLFVRLARTERGHLLPLATLALALGVLAKLPGIGAGLALAWLTFGLVIEGRLARALTLVAAGSVVLIAVGAYYAWAIHLGTTYPPYHVAGDGYIWDKGLAAFIEQRFFASQLWYNLVWWYLGLPLMALVVIGLLSPPPARAGAPAASAWLFHFWLAGAGLVFLAGAQEIVTNPWNLHVFSVPVAALAGRALLLLAGGGWPARPSWALARILGLTAFVVYASTLPLVDSTKRPRHEATMILGQALEAVSQPGDLVITVATEVGNPIGIYYSRRRGWVFPPGGGQVDWSRFVEHEEALAQLETLRAEGARWFGIARNATDSWGRLFVEHHAALLDHLDQTAQRVVDTEAILIFDLAPVDAGAH